MLVVQWLGSIDYQQAWDLQVRLADEIARHVSPPTLLLLEHPHTYTFGRSGHAENLLWSEAELERRGVQVHWVDRGGDITYHGPGQLVGYPLLPLAPPNWNTTSKGHLPQADYVGYLRRLEKALIETLAELGLPGCQALEGLTGVWVPGSPLPAKIAAIGVKVDARGISRHGFALNVRTDMEYWQGIVGCGLAGYPVANLSDYVQPAPGMPTVVEAASNAFRRAFNTGFG